MTPPTHCLECNAPLGPQDTGGVCPKCLLKLGLASQLASGSLPATARGLRDDGSIVEPFDFGGYRILRLLGKGGMGAVYEAEQLESGRRVALKVLGHTLDTREMHARFVREGQLAAAVRHPNVVAVLAADEIEGTPAIAMELLHEGTLKDRVKARGPLPVAEAVDAVLQIIDGLEAAHAAGVLHRDVKPANCFTGADGTVKVGDFGLSISTLAKAEHSLTQSGAVLGTPAFAAPEQLRGEEIDARADIYAVGATLYYLLTGKPTHDAENVVALIASVLEKKPANVRALRPGVPASLARVVMRCLEKQRAARFPDYEALRDALEPFSSPAPTPATVGLRVIAGVIDSTIATLPEFVAIGIWGVDVSHRWLIERDPASLGWIVFGVVFCLAYFAIQEALWGATFGKLLCGLRVQKAGGGGPPGWSAAVLRSVMFNFVVIVTPLLGMLLYAPADVIAAEAGPGLLPTEGLEIVIFVALFITIRRRNGFAALHDLATGTRVVSARELDTPAPLAFESPLPSPSPGGEKIGGFAVIARGETLIEAVDEKLRRRVWIVPCQPGAAPLTAARREISRPTRLGWLQGRRTTDESWDAFEAAAGAPLVDFLDGSQPWQRVRRWLIDLADEITAARSDGTLPERIGAHHVWITTTGRAVLLDVPAPGVAERPLHAVPDAAELQHFLADIATRAAGAGSGSVIPLHAHSLLSSLRDARLEAHEIVAGNLHAIARRPARVTPRRRLLSLLAGPAAALAFGILLFGIGTGEERRMNAWWAQNHPIVPPLQRASALIQRQDISLRQRAALEVHIAGHHRDIVSDDAFWQMPEVRGYYYPNPEDYRQRFTDIIERHGEVTPAGLRDADETLQRKLFPKFDTWIRGEIAAMAFGIMSGLLLLGGVATLVVTFASGAPLGLRMSGLALVSANGHPLTRGRAGLRSAVAWVPALLILSCVAGGSFLPMFRTAVLTAAGSLAICFIAFVIAAARHPSRSPLDRLCRTHIVPR